MLRKRDIIHRSGKLFLLVGILAIATIFRVIGLKTFLSKKYKNFNIGIKIARVYGNRGDIYSINNQIISTTAVTYDIYWDSHTDYIKRHPELVEKNLLALADSLSHIYKTSTQKVYKYLLGKYKSKSRFVPIHPKASVTQAERIKKFPIFREGKYHGGLILIPKKRRIHPFDKLAHRLIGSCTFEKGQAKAHSGLEYSYNSQLQGKPGLVVLRRGPKNISLVDKVIIPPVDGINIQTTIDMNIQYFLEHALEKRLKELKAQRGIGIVMDVKTGEIRAMANLTLDSIDSTFHEVENLAVQWLYEPGSVMKPLSMIALLEEYPDIKLSKLIDTDHGEYNVADHTFRDDKKGGWGIITLQQAVEHSSNVGVAKIIIQYFQNRQQHFIDRLVSLGVDRKTGIDLYQENTQTLKDTRNKNWWGRVSLGQIAIGYEHSMTALQILALYNAIANNGVYTIPHLVHGYVYDGKEHPLKFNAEKGVIASRATITKIKKMLEGVVLRGTAHQTVYCPDLKIAGKTGTAKIYNYKLKRYQDVYNTTFVGYFPADIPRYTMIIVIFKPQADRSGALAAGPVFKEVALKIYNYDWSLHNQKNYVVNYMPRTDEIPKVKSGFRVPIINLVRTFNLLYTDTLEKSPWTRVITSEHKLELVPFFSINKKYTPTISMSAQDASYILSNKGYRIIIQGIGTVVSEQNINKKTKKLQLQ